MSRLLCCKRTSILSAFLTTLVVITPATALPIDPPARRHENFDADPKWEGRSNRNLPETINEVTQDFGHRTSQFAGGEAAGEIGGAIYKHKTFASYGKPIAKKTLDDRLSASGMVFLRESNPSSAIMVGWFNSDSRGWRTRNSLAFRLFGTSGYGRLTFEYGTQKGGMATYRMSGDPFLLVRDAVGTRPAEKLFLEGMHVTTFDMLKATDAAGFDIKRFAESRPHRWTLDYDPDGAGGLGEITFAFDGHKAALPLEPGYRQHGAVFDRFGLFNVMLESGGGPMEVYFDDLTIDDVKEDFTSDPGWIGVANRQTMKARVVDGAHDFGYSRTNHVSGGAPGEVGGVMFRYLPFSYYADAQIGRLTLDDELFASGKVCFPYATSDSGVLVGWFNSQTALDEAGPARMSPPNFLGAVIEGPSRIGHYHRPTYKTASGLAGDSRIGPLLEPDGRPNDFTLHYQPQANNGEGALTVTLDDQATTLNLAKGHKAAGATFDRFGFLSWQSPGGHFMEIYWDELSYTTGNRDTKK